MRRAACLAAASLVMSAGLTVPAVLAHAAVKAVADVDPAVVRAIDAAGKADFWVDLGASADLSGAAQIKDWAERGRFVVDRLKAVASVSQAGVVADLRSQGVKFRAFWVGNRIVVRSGTRTLLDALAGRSEVTRISATHTYTIPKPQRGGKVAQTGDVEWNVADVRADQVWREFGVRGDGIVVGSIDTGVQFDHPALVAAYRGTRPDGTFDHNYNWYDPDSACTPSAPKPCDDTGHGTEVMGTIAGDGGTGNHIGTAPGARWITAKACKVTFCDDVSLLAAGQWMLAPTDLAGNNPDPARRPQVINNSWGTDDGADGWYRDTVRAWQAAGQFPAFAGGNNGVNRCATIGAPASYPESYSVGGYNAENALAYDSSLGPSPIDGSIKPDIVAPGVGVRSSTVGRGYAVDSGTSFAVAHVSGAVALLLSATPGLIGDVPALRAALDGSAADPGLPDALGCGTAPGADNSFGAGRLDAFAAVSRVAGAGRATVTGTITDTGTGKPVAGARITAEGAEHDEATTGTDGVYRLFLAPGDYTFTAGAFGYGVATAALTLPAGQTIHHDASLAAQPRVTVSGVVTDGSGHGWPLRARVDIGGYPGGPVFTDPATGRYTVSLVPGDVRTFTVSPADGGYEPVTRTVTVPSGDAAQDFALKADATCSAPGYRLHSGIFERFDAPGKPAGWTVDNENPDPFDPDLRSWRFADPAGRGNLTGGSGGFAIVDSDFDGWTGALDTALVSPAVDLTGIADPVVRFNHDLPVFSAETFDVDVSVENGPWANVWHHAGDNGLGDLRGPRVESVPIPAAAGHASVRVRFHYQSGWDWWWEVDNVLVGGAACDVVPGALAVGTVTDAVTGGPLAGATVATADDPNRTVSTDRDGRYTYFASAGTHTFTAGRQGYRSVERPVQLPADGVVRADFALGSGHLVVTPGKIASTVTLGGTARTTLTLTNDGTEDVRFSLTERDRGFTSATAPNAPSGAAVHRVRADAKAGRRGLPPNPEPDGGSAAPRTPPWQDVAPAPGRITEAAAAAHDGKIYVAGGITTADGDNTLNDLSVYDPATNAWTVKADMAAGREAPVAAFIGNRLYVAGGWDDAGKMPTGLEIYDPATDAWSAGADVPAGRARAGVAVVDDQFYFIAGCVDAMCAKTRSAYRYDAGKDTWQRIADYPVAVASPSCGAIDGAVYCAGGTDRHDEFGAALPTAAAYTYDATADRWLPVAPMTVPTWASAHAVVNGQLIVAGGASTGFVTNEVFAYDPVTDVWRPLPPANDADYSASGACGFYKIGGTVADYPAPRTRVVERLPGYDQCGPADMPWLALSTTSGTLAPGQSATVTADVSLAGAGEPGTYAGAIAVKQDTPHEFRPIPVTVTAQPPASWGKIEGTVTGLGHCDTRGTALGGATVTLDGVTRDFSLRTGTDGRFAAWMDSANGPVGISVVRDAYAGTTVSGVGVTAGKTSTKDLTLRRAEGCAAAEPERLDLTVRSGQKVTRDLVLGNRGAGSYGIGVAETPFLLDPVRSIPVAAPAGPSRWTAGNAPATPVPPIASWFDAAPLPGGVSSYARAQCDGDPDHVYVLSGVNASGVSVDTTWRYDARTNSWTELAALPQTLWPGSPASFGLTQPTATCEAGQIHLIGGTHAFVYTNFHFVYDIATDTWTTATPAPRVVAAAASAAWNGRIYLAGGAGDVVHGTTGEVDVYDIATGTWSTAAPMPVPAHDAGYAQSGRYLYVVGGEDDEEGQLGLVTTPQRLDLVTGTWSTGPALGTGVIVGGLAATGSAIYFMGGFEPFHGATDHVDRLATGAWPGGAWTAFDHLPTDDAAFTGFCTEAITGGEIGVIGGFNGEFGTDRIPVHGVGPERCPTVRADVPWLSAQPANATVPADGAATVGVSVDATGLQPGEQTATLLISTTEPGAPELRVPVRLTVTPAALPSLYLSLAKPATVGGLAVADEDIIGINPDGVVTPYFDGSDVGLAGAAIDAFARLGDGSLVLSFADPATVPGVPGTVDDSDLVRFVPTALGADTAGRFTMWLDGSDVGLTTDDEDVDAADVLPDGRIVLSCTGNVKVNGVDAAGEDLIAFTPSSLGDNTAGRFALHFDGSDVGLTTAGENIDAVAFGPNGTLALSTTGALAVPGLAAMADDVVTFTPAQLGKDTKGTFAGTPLFEGTPLGLDANNLTGVDLP